MPLLRITEGFGAGFAIELGERKVTIGRDPSNQVQIGDPKASRVHVSIHKEDGDFVLTDLGSSNGTWNDDGRIERKILHDHEIFRIGSTYLRLEEEANEPETEDEEPENSLAATLPGSFHDTTGMIAGLDGHSSLFSRKQNPDSNLQTQNLYLLMLHELVLRSNEASNRNELFEILDDLAAEALEGDRVAVFLPTDDGWTLWPTHKRRLQARFGTTPFSRTLLEAVHRKREPLLCNDSDSADVDVSTSMVQAGVHASMAAPMRIGDEVHGLLYVDRLSGEEGFQRTELEFLSAIANQLAVRSANFDKVSQLENEVERLKKDTDAEIENFIGTDPATERVRSFIEKAAPADAPVLICGASGTGKELVARNILARSKRHDMPMQTVNCAAIAENLVEATLFGFVKGAFEGADDGQPGIFELAHNGTLLLDEIGELPLHIQAKLLRVLEQGELHRMGEGTTRHVDVRVLAATNRNLEEEVQKGQFREDLYHRLNVLTLNVPKLSERPKDLEPLIEHFLSEAATKAGQEMKKISPKARALLLGYEWPGNVRQLKNIIERTVIMAPSDIIQAEDLPDTLRETTAQSFQAPITTLADIERAHIMRVLDHCGGNKKATAEILGIDRSTLYAKLRNYGVK